MGQLLLVLLVIGLCVWMMRRGGCCGMGKRENKGDADNKSRSCH